uniref:Uncharacterized protein n=1 Tax=Populus trichocarpa TaxID=3694 RepID=A0A2K1YUK2_POPTR
MSSRSPSPSPSPSHQQNSRLPLQLSHSRVSLTRPLTSLSQPATPAFTREESHDRSSFSNRLSTVPTDRPLAAVADLLHRRSPASSTPCCQYMEQGRRG